MSTAPNITTPTLPLAPARPSLTWTVWPPARPEQQHVAHGGHCEIGPWSKLCRWVEREHAGNVYAKSRGPQWAPVANMDGHRCIDSTTAIYALALDCDGAGDWHRILVHLDSVGAAYLAYRSPGHSPELPKWRLVLPWSEPYITQGAPQEANRVWHDIYHHARVLLGGLSGFAEPDRAGFDRATASVANVFYLGHRRTADTPIREVRWSDGLALDGAAVLASVPFVAGTTTADPFRTVSLARGATGGRSEKKKLPADALIVLTQDGREVASVPFATIRGRSHCLCPQHGGSGRGSAWVDVGYGGVPAIQCGPCGTRWTPGTGTVEASTAADGTFDVDELLGSVEGTAAAGQEYTDPHTERVEAQKRAEAMDRYWGPLVERAKKKKAEAAALDLALVAVAYYANRAGRKQRGRMRAPYMAGGLTYKQWQTTRCGFSQLLADPTANTAGGKHRGCGKQSCYVCGPRLLARKAASIAWMPQLDKDNHIVGEPLTQRTLYRFEYPSVAAWQSRKKYEAKKARKSRVPPNESQYDTDRTRLGVLAESALVYVAFSLPDRVVILASRDLPRRGTTSTQLTTSADIAEAIYDLTAKTIRVEEAVMDIRTGHPWVRAVQISTSQGVVGDPDRVGRLGSGSAWMAVEDRSVPPEEVEAILRAEGCRVTTPPGAKDEATPTSWVQSAPIHDPAVWERIRGQARLCDAAPPAAPQGIAPGREAAEMDQAAATLEEHSDTHTHIKEQAA